MEVCLETVDDQKQEDIYYVKYTKLVQKCEQYRLENERLLNHIYQVKKLLFRYRKQRRSLIMRMEKHDPNFRLYPYNLKLVIT